MVGQRLYVEGKDFKDGLTSLWRRNALAAVDCFSIRSNKPHLDVTLFPFPHLNRDVRHCVPRVMNPDEQQRQRRESDDEQTSMGVIADEESSSDGDRV